MRYATLIFLVLMFPILIGANAIPGYLVSQPLFALHIVKIQLTPEAIAMTDLPEGLYAEAEAFGLRELDENAARFGESIVLRAHIRLKDKEFEQRHGVDRWFLLKYKQDIDVKAAIKAFKALPDYIEEAIPEYYAYTQYTPNDPLFPNNWGHNNTAQLPVYQNGSHSGAGVGTIGFDARIQSAWDQTQGMGSASIIIAIIDTGVDTAHPDLRLVAGYDYGDNDSNPMDNSAEAGHGTACSGVAAGIGNNGIGVAGSAPGCSVMPLKIADSGGSLQFTYIENALFHCGNNNVDVASMSFGATMSYGSSPSTDTAVAYAYNNGVALFAATANGNTSSIAYPANHPNVISVGAASPTGQRKSTTSSDGEYWWGSNYGVNTQDSNNAVDIMGPTILPATDITGAAGYDNGNYSLWFNGTSCATPYVAGVAGLILSKDPSLTPAQLRSTMTSTATDMTIDGGAGWDRFTGYGLVNANAALLSLVPGMPSCTITAPLNGAVLNLNSTITINVTATDTDGVITQVRFFINDVLMNTDTSAPFTWNWNTTGYSGGSHSIKAIATDNNGNNAEHTISISLLAPPDEGFESGNFSAYPWVNASASPWTVQSADAYSGTYSARSGAIGHNANTSLSVTVNVTGAGNISFFQKVSSEANYDYLRFYIDDVQQGQWSGSGSWTQQSYPVAAGAHTFRWTYSKDGSVIGGSDCAWIDHILFPPTGVFYAPPLNLSASPSHQSVKLDWIAPVTGSPTGYKIFKNSALLTTVTALTYTDTAVTNGNTYAYYLKAVYSGGESDATPTVNATPNAVAPTNLAASAGNGFVILAWTGATGRETIQEFGSSDRAISGYKVYRNSSLLTTVTGTSYTDNAVVNETTYSYYVTTVYSNPAGESAASNTVQAMPTAVMPSEAILGTGTSATATNEGAPINIWYRSLHGQAVYTAAELNAAGIFGPINISQLGFYNVSAPINPMPNFIIRLKHTTDTNVANWQTATGMTTVYSNASYMPTVGGYQMLTLSTPFLWNGTSNIVVDTAFDMVTAYDQSGTVQYTSVTNGYRYLRSDTANQGNFFSGGTVTEYRPNLKLIFIPNATGPMIVADPLYLAYGDVAVGESGQQQFTIQNSGDQTLTGTISTPAGYTVSLSARDSGFDFVTSDRNVLSISVNAGQSRAYNLSFAPAIAGTYNGTVVISTNAVNSPTVNISVSGNGYIPPTIVIDND
ncbi:MAG: S8 family serine peptidase, partial [Candidatus Cloacimonadaceae bacterium]|nr:S8 family serine peptidase [Candidatus Cloacimonadaceae bacterium]